MSTSRTRFAAVAAAVLAAACGGGDGGGDAGPQPPTYVLISAANQDTVARASLASIMPFLNVPVVATAAPAPNTTFKAGLAPLALRSIKAGIRLSSPPEGMARALAQYQATYPCEISGTMTVVLDDKDNNGTVSAGDSMSISFSQCNDGTGSIMNGGLGMTIATYSKTAAAEDMTGSMSFQTLALADSTGSFSMAGGVSFHINQTTTSNGVDLLGSYTVASGGLTVGKQSISGGLSDTFSYRAGYAVSDRDFTSSIQGVPSWEVITASGSFGSQQLGGDLSLNTTTPFRSVYATDATGDIFPSEGQLVATGHNNTRIRLTATTTVQVRMELCDDGDDVYEASKMVTWDWLFQ